LAKVLADLVVRSPEIPVVHNVHAATESDPQKIKSLLVEQIYSPVQWTRCVETIAGTGVTRFVECGPGKVLSGLSRRIDKSLQSFSLEEPDELLATLTALNQH
jgi:[acyl-carrier-protein] S-malonyltransferase